MILSGETETVIRERAYSIWESEGRPHGRDTAHWFKAMEELFAAAPVGAEAINIKPKATRAKKAAEPVVVAAPAPAKKKALAKKKS
ncbi:MAG: DUF2934 domain-containing protein [Bauldia sp.]|nr:DUF2934 domain-containing protein [Bauldia sp.]